MLRKRNKNLSYTQRIQIETLYNSRCPRKKICEIVGIHKSTLCRELKRGAYERKSIYPDFWYGKRIYYKTSYSANIAQERYKRVCSAKGRPLKIGNDYEFVHYIERRVLEEKINPCAILGQIKRNKIAFKTSISRTTLYRYIRMGLFENITLVKRKPEYKKLIVKRAPKGTSIERRPEVINSRTTFGHWEMDCVCGSTKSVFLVLTERLTRKEFIIKMDNQKANSVVKCLDKLEKYYGEVFYKIFKTITVDNGSEFANFYGMERSILYENKKRTLIYYCHPYTSCERGSNERMNREIRRLVPKGTDISKISEEHTKQIENWLNNYPKSVLHYATANELFNEQLRLIT